MGLFIPDCSAIDDQTTTSLSVQGSAERFCLRRGPDSTPQVNRAALLSALVKASKPRHRKGRATLPGFLLLTSFAYLAYFAVN
jgi:hypothetical protein